MKKIILPVFSLLAICTYVTAQNVNDATKFIYYQRYSSAKQVLQKLMASNPKDAATIYWLGQTYIGNRQIDSAKVIYQNALTAGVNDPWIWVGSGEVDVLQGGDINAAKQKFEQAITASTSNKGKNKGPNADILNAVGRAMAAGSSTQGDANYGIDKLKQAAQINPKDPSIFISLGICYLKLGGDHGGEAVTAFQQATQINPQYAEAFYRTGKIYQSQRNKESMDEWYGKAIAADATYAPVYLAYFQYYEEKDVNAAKEYLDKWVANADKDCNTDYFVGDYLFRAGKYQESLQQAKNMEAGNCKNYARLNVLYAYDYDRLGDSVQARSYIQKFFSLPHDSSDVQPADYAFAGTVLAKFPQSADSAGIYLQKAIVLDTVKEDQNDYLNKASDIAARTGNYGMQLQLIKSLQSISGAKLSETQFFTMGKAIADAAQKDSTVAFDSTKYLLGDSVLQSYAAAYPNKPQPYSFRVRYAKFSDKDTSRGLALPAIAAQNQFETKDTAAASKQIIFRNDVYLLIYYAQYAQGEKADNYKKAISIADEMISLYPDASSDENKYAAGIKGKLQGALDKYQKAKSSTKTSGGK